MAAYLSGALDLGMTRRDALLSEISVVNEICDIRAKAHKEMRGKHGR